MVQLVYPEYRLGRKSKKLRFSSVYSFLFLLLIHPMTAHWGYAKDAPQESSHAIKESSHDVAEAKSLIASLGQQAISVLTDKKSDPAKTQQEFRRLLHQGFDYKAIAKFALGRYWRQADRAQQEEYLKLFEEMIVQAYTSRFKDYTNEAFKATKARADASGGYTVNSEIDRPNGPSIHVDWKVFKGKDKSFRIFDVKVDGVSMSVTQRSEFASIIEREGEGIAGLLRVLKERTS